MEKRMIFDKMMNNAQIFIDIFCLSESKKNKNKNKHDTIILLIKIVSHFQIVAGHTRNTIKTKRKLQC